MHVCEDCGFEAKTGGGLSAHRRKHGASDRANVVAIEKTIAALEELGRIEPVDAARVQLLRSLAKAVDDDPLNGSLWRHYHSAIDDLMKADDDADDALAAAVAEIRGSTQVGD